MQKVKIGLSIWYILLAGHPCTPATLTQALGWSSWQPGIETLTPYHSPPHLDHLWPGVQNAFKKDHLEPIY